MDNLIIFAIVLFIINLIIYKPLKKLMERLVKDNLEPQFKAVEKLSIDLQNTAIKLKKREDEFIIEVEKNIKRRKKEFKLAEILFNKMKDRAIELEKREKEIDEFFEQRMGGTEVHKIKNIIKGKYESFPFIVVTDS